jgi:hypothetical protein
MYRHIVLLSIPFVQEHTHRYLGFYCGQICYRSLCLAFGIGTTINLMQCSIILVYRLFVFNTSEHFDLLVDVILTGGLGDETRTMNICMNIEVKHKGNVEGVQFISRRNLSNLWRAPLAHWDLREMVITNGYPLEENEWKTAEWIVEKDFVTSSMIERVINTSHRVTEAVLSAEINNYGRVRSTVPFAKNPSHQLGYATSVIRHRRVI